MGFADNLGGCGVELHLAEEVSDDLLERGDRNFVGGANLDNRVVPNAIVSPCVDGHALHRNGFGGSKSTTKVCDVSRDDRRAFFNAANVRGKISNGRIGAVEASIGCVLVLLKKTWLCLK